MSQERYEIRKKLGEGGAGSVYIAHDTRLDREVAIKRLSNEGEGWSQDTVDSLLKEARMLSSLSHPNIVTIYDADVDEDGPYVIMELLIGRNIDDLIAENTLTASDFEDFSTQCLEALIAAHALDLIHRDIKPNNIVLKWLPSGKFQAKLLDFGMAKLSKEPTKQTVDQSDSVFGSIYFMAPEQFERTELDARTDLYALGSVFYYTLTGFYPFTGDSPAEVMASHLTHRVRPITDFRDDLPEWLTNWVMWLINREMEHRPQTAQDALDLFSANLANAPLKQTSSISTKFDKNTEGQYFGQEGAGVKTVKINKEATKHKGASVMAPVLLAHDGKLITQAEEAAPIPVAQPTVKVTQAMVQPTVKLATPEPPVVKAAPTEPSAELPKTVKLATPQPTVNLATPKAPETPLATVPLVSPSAPAQPGQTVSLSSPTPGAEKTTTLSSPQPSAGKLAKAQAPVNTQAAGSTKGPTKIKRTAGSQPSGQPVELPNAETMGAPKSNNGLIAILSMVVIALIVVGGLLAYKMGENRKIEALNALLVPSKQKQKNIPTTKENIELLLDQLYTVSGQFENNLIYQRLLDAESADGTDIDLKIATFATQPTEDILPEVRKALFLVLGGRKGESTMPMIQEFITTYEKEEVVTSALSSLSKSAQDTDLDFFTEIILTTESTGKREAAEQVASRIVERSQNQSALAAKLATVHSKAQNDLAKASLDRLIALTGGDDAKGRIRDGLSSGDRNKVIPALSMLHTWKDGTMTQEGIDFWVGSTDPAIRDKAFKAVFNLMRLHHMKDPAAEEYWKQFAENAQNTAEKMNVITALGSLKEPYVLPLLKPFLDDTNSSVINKAKRAVRNVEKK